MSECTHDILTWDKNCDYYRCGKCGAFVDPQNNYEDFDDHDLTCPECGGTGGNKWDDGVTDCDYCDGEGYLWWL